MRIIRKYKYPLTVMVIILILSLTIMTKIKLAKGKYEDIVTEDSVLIKTETPSANEEKLCTVDIKGAVNNPGVYRLNCDSYVEDIIKEAGDLTENADTSLINLAKKITDEMVIIIYTKEEINNECICQEINNESLINGQVNNSNDLININTATIDELKKIPGIGDSKARAIIAYRTNNGKFTTIEDIKKVSGIGDKIYEQIKIYITT